MSWSLEGLARLVEVILAGGVGVIARDIVSFFIRKGTSSQPDVKRVTEQGIIERAMLNLSNANDELTDDVTRVRKELSYQQDRNRQREEWWQSRWDEREQRWNTREAELQQEIDRMRQRMVEMIQELDQMRDRVNRQDS